MKKSIPYVLSAGVLLTLLFSLSTAFMSVERPMQPAEISRTTYNYIVIYPDGSIDSLEDFKPTSDCSGYYINDRYDTIMPAGDYEVKCIRK